MDHLSGTAGLCPRAEMVELRGATLEQTEGRGGEAG